METYVQQLSMIATYPNKFPSITSFGISDVLQFKNPHEKDYSDTRIDDAIESHLKQFTDREPHLSLGYVHEKWEKRQKNHQEDCLKQKEALKHHFQALWKNGSGDLNISVYFSMLTSKCELEEEVREFFNRWRNAEKLHKFIETVMSQLEKIQNGRFPAFVLLDCDQAVDILSNRTTFALSTNPNFDRLGLKYHSKSDLLGIAPYTLPLEFVPIDQTNIMNDVSFLNSSKFVENNTHYKEVWDALVKPLTNSLHLACADSNYLTGGINLRNSEIEYELKNYFERADATYMGLCSRLTSLLKPNVEDDHYLELQQNVFLWDSIGPYDLLMQWTKYPTSGATGKELISFALSIKHVQRARRCLRLLSNGREELHMHLVNDLSIRFSDSNAGFNALWNGYDNPEFIMFEVDNDISIRDTQAMVAFEILKEKNDGDSLGQNRLMQLNMGEGKTAVIMPIVLARAARGDSVVRATVLSSLYTTNYNDWQYKLGGLLNRRIYPLLCRRDLAMNVERAKIMLKICRRVQREKNIIVTVPEHRLSLENKAIELASDLTMACDFKASKKLHEVVKFLWQYGREFLDESDEILSPKYQLIYTLGAPCNMEGVQVRWEIHATIYESLARHSSSLSKSFSSDVIELGKSLSDVHENGYIGLRLLEDSKKCEEAYDAIKKCIVDDILNGQSKLKVILNKEQRKKWQRCVMGNGIGNDVKDLPFHEQIIALCLRGMLEHNVLKIVLFKRWRVNYGNHPTRKGYKMAVPYRAKDVAAERTEFGHPDVALSLTFAHYYQAGLNKMELRHAFEKLKNKGNSYAKAQYSSWVGSENVKVMEGFTSYEGVNINDKAFFEEKLYPIFRNNMQVIRFWLFELVLPIQAKQFPKKLLSTAPELCRSSKLGKLWTAVTTGFSGTDDLSLLLPPTIVQENLDSLKKTNGIQLKNLLREENNDYSNLLNEDTTKELLERILFKSPHINVVLDVGALVLHKSNRGFVESWLSIRKDMDAAAFFEDSKVFVLTQGGTLLNFDESPHSHNMSKCLLYLDEIHTRGSDFRLPSNSRAILTLGKGLQKDKFIQACMRMRQLGHGHSLSFVASHEVNCVLENDFGLHQSRHKDLGHVLAILEWTISNSVKSLCSLMPYFVDQMRSTLVKANAYNNFFIDSNDISLGSIAKSCIMDEILELQHLYGQEYGDEFLFNIVDHRLNERSLFGNSRTQLQELANSLRERFRRLAHNIKQPCNMLDEEQERELEQELEEEINLERPPPAIPLIPHFSDGLLKVLQPGQLQRRRSQHQSVAELCKLYLLPLCTIFKGTVFYESPIGIQLKTDQAFVTKDFVDTVKGERGKECFLKNIRWFLKWSSDPGHTVVIVSNFEAEKLSNLLSSEIRDMLTLNGHLPYLYAFVAMTRFQQPRQYLTNSSCDPPVEIHICAGSVHADAELAKNIRNFLSVFPRPPTRTGMKTWENLLDEGLIHSDGFVSPEHRGEVEKKSEDFDGSIETMFQSSPVKDLQKLYADCRHLDSELPYSIIGKLLGFSVLASKSDNNNDGS
eukprot:CAMPEP_0184860846 /NCGR_PEP_ID=MMETSP0580-20130426/5651_1 /TAXON_ID=1118495 /ORGANISM="Dactyliosolen fragilissimus" /LENGTH=1532 /DNA_ID=CAMNT_0027358101 /DNA_START=132 /DNA_END=4730 /DNA_ORIENTATION=+